MLPFKEYQLPDGDFQESPEHQELKKALEKCLDGCSLKNLRHVPVTPCLVWKEKGRRNELCLVGYDEKQFSPEDDIALSCLRAGVNRLLDERWPGGVVRGVPFRVALIFGDNPFERNEEKEKDTSAKKNADTLNVLPVAPKFTLDRMVLSAELKESLDDVIHLVRLRHKIYEEWGFAEVDPIPRAILNFYGAPGTGKTMAAHALADAFKCSILALNYADIESKFVGDAPKNLMRAFEIAKQHGALLFFDEADSFLGKRISNVTQSADQAVNSLRSQLLMLLEDFEGIVVFATNLMENYDKAFNSRILKHIRFELPTPELRTLLIRKMIPAKMPLKEGDFSKAHIQELTDMAEGFSGREIKNAVLGGIVRSARDKDAFAFEDAKQSFADVKKTVPNTGKTDAPKEKLAKEIRRNLGWRGKRKPASARAVRESARAVSRNVNKVKVLQ